MRPHRFGPALALVAISALGGALRFWAIGDKGLWLDEAFSVWLAWQPWHEMRAWLVRIDQHPPLYYTLLHLWIKLAGDTPGAVRQLSALFGAATIPVIFFLGRRLLGVRVGLLAALILALSPFHVRFAQETRMYTLLALNAGLALLALTHILTKTAPSCSSCGRLRLVFHAGRDATTPAGENAAEHSERRAVARSRRRRSGHGAWPPPSTTQRELLRCSAQDASRDIFRTDPHVAGGATGNENVAQAAGLSSRRRAQSSGLRYRAISRAGEGGDAAPSPPSQGEPVLSLPKGGRGVGQPIWLNTIATGLPWIGYMIFTAATMLSHNTAILFPVAVNLFVLGFIRWGQGARNPQSAAPSLAPPALRTWLIAQAGVFLLWSPWLTAFVQQSVGVYREFWITYPTLGTTLATIKTFLSAMFPARDGWADLIWIAYGLIGLLGGVRLRRSPARLAFLAVIFFTPVIGEWLSGLGRPIFDDRTLIWATIPLYLLLAAGIAGLRRKGYIAATLALIIAVNGLSLQEYYLRFEKEQWDQAAAYVAARAQPDDLLLFNATWVQIPFDYYFRQYHLPVVKHGAPVDLFDRGVLEPKMTESDLPRLRELVADKPHVWLIYSHNWYTDPHGLIPVALSQNLKLLDRRRFNGLEVRLYGILELTAALP